MKFSVDVDVIMAKVIEVEANSEEEAIAKVDEMINKNPYNFTNGFSHYVKHDVIDANEIDEEG